MKARITANILINGQHVEKGTVVDLDKGLFHELRQANKAVPADDMAVEVEEPVAENKEADETVGRRGKRK